MKIEKKKEKEFKNYENYEKEFSSFKIIIKSIFLLRYLAKIKVYLRKLLN